MTIRTLVTLFVLFSGGIASAGASEPPPKAGAAGKPNRLAKESSPYLLQHAHNPVDWYPWGPEAFERAKKEKKLVFLSIGYSSCHWCHVMERECFSNPAVAKLMNESFVCIKVDREERPDVDDIYMTALQVTGQGGGWPLSMFLTPEGKPIFGGTYFPPEDRKVGDETVPGFKTIIAKVNELYAKEKAGLLKQADHVAEMTADALERNSRVVALVTLERQLIKDALESYSIDPEHGGTGSRARMFQGAKFPRPAVWFFILQQTRKPGNEAYAKATRLTLHKMAEGGIFDHIGGGFHRYSTERTWTVPHFEKMLYDNAQLVELYSEAYRTDPDPLYRRVVAETLTFVKREMTNTEGAFYSALDADSNGKEGEFYVWTTNEIKAVLGTDADTTFLRSVYGVTAPNFEEKFHILRLPKPMAEIATDLKITEAELLRRLEPLRAKLLAHRAKRVRPFLDTKVIAAWNGQMIAAYAKAGEVFKNRAYTDAAAKAADFILAKMRDKDGRLLRISAAAPGGKPTAKGNAFLEDYAEVIAGLLNLHDATGEKRWLDEAKSLAELAGKWYADAPHGGFFYTAHDHEKLFARAKDSYDGAQPSGNGVMARNLLRLWRKTNEVKYRDSCARTVKAFSLTLKTNPGGVPGLARALDELLDIAEKEPAALNPKAPPTTDPATRVRVSADVVKAVVKPSQTAGLTVTLTVAEPWHLYANPVGNEMLKENATLVEVFAGGKPVPGVTVDYPKGNRIKDTTGDEYSIYQGTVTLTVKLPPGVAGEPEVRVRILACKEGKCLLPSTLKLSAKR